MSSNYSYVLLHFKNAGLPVILRRVATQVCLLYVKA